MVELVELLLAAGLLVGAALQPATNTAALSAIKIKVAFILYSSLPPSPMPPICECGKNYFFNLRDAVA